MINAGYTSLWYGILLAEMFEQDYGSKDTRWLFWFAGVIAIYCVLSFFPQTEAIASWVGIVGAAIGAALFRLAIRRWFKGNFSGD